ADLVHPRIPGPIVHHREIAGQPVVKVFGCRGIVSELAGIVQSPDALTHQRAAEDTELRPAVTVPVPDNRGIAWQAEREGAVAARHPVPQPVVIQIEVPDAVVKDSDPRLSVSAPVTRDGLIARHTKGTEPVLGIVRVASIAIEEPRTG